MSETLVLFFKVPQLQRECTGLGESAPGHFCAPRAGSRRRHRGQWGGQVRDNAEGRGLTRVHYQP